MGFAAAEVEPAEAAVCEFEAAVTGAAAAG
jgi:hypothetical protein